MPWRVRFEKTEWELDACKKEFREALDTSGIDKECIALCTAMNNLPGIYTIESCCGHEKQPFRIWFKVTDLAVLPNLLYWIDG